MASMARFQKLWHVSSSCFSSSPSQLSRSCCSWCCGSCLLSRLPLHQARQAINSTSTFTQHRYAGKAHNACTHAAAPTMIDRFLQRCTRRGAGIQSFSTPLSTGRHDNNLLLHTTLLSETILLSAVQCPMCFHE